MNNYRSGIVSMNRFIELMEQLKGEFDTIAREIYNVKLQKEEFERRHQLQLKEMVEIQGQYFEMERKHQQMKSKYEEEILHLRTRLGISPVNTTNFEQQPIRSPRTNLGYSLPPLPRQQDLKKTEITEDSGVDWQVGYNPVVPREVTIELNHDLDHSSVVCCVNFSKDGNFLATGCNHSAQIYNVNTGEKIRVFQDGTNDHELYIRSVCFSPDGKFLVTGAEDRSVKVYNIETRALLHDFVGHGSDIYSLDYSPNSKFIVSGSGDRTIKIWNVDEGKCSYTIGDDKVGPFDGITSVAISPTGQFLAAGSIDKIVRLWELETGKLIHAFEGHSNAVYSVSFSPDGKSLASGSLDKTLRLWDLVDKTHKVIVGHRDFVLSVAFSPDGNWLISGSKDRTVHFWEHRAGVAHLILQGHANSVLNVAISGKSNSELGKFATGSGDQKARIWEWKKK